MRPILIFRHAPEDGPGYFARFLERERLSYRLIRVDVGEAIPERIGEAAGLVFMGGPQSVNDPLDWIPGALRLIRDAVESDLPVLGHCLGGQLLSKALGGQVQASPAEEVGWLGVRKVPGPAASSWLSSLPEEFTVFQWHRESFSIPPGCERLLESDGCPNQGFAVGRSLGLQCHIEMLAEMVGEWTADGDLLARASATVQTPDQILADLQDRVEGLHRVADRLYGRWLQGVT
ncbi:MAG: type 1 glutamine amidotransferase [Deltaproteobacteria bacterium]|nr:type 1 glutamine amidotransferase [Deltaproteobacteria bacterium]